VSLSFPCLLCHLYLMLHIRHVVLGTRPSLCASSRAPFRVRRSDCLRRRWACHQQRSTASLRHSPLWALAYLPTTLLGPSRAFRSRRSLYSRLKIHVGHANMDGSRRSGWPCPKQSVPRIFGRGGSRTWAETSHTHPPVYSKVARLLQESTVLEDHEVGRKHAPSRRSRDLRVQVSWSRQQGTTHHVGGHGSCVS